VRDLSMEPNKIPLKWGKSHEDSHDTPRLLVLAVDGATFGVHASACGLYVHSLKVERRTEAEGVSLKRDLQNRRRSVYLLSKIGLESNHLVSFGTVDGLGSPSYVDFASSSYGHSILDFGLGSGEADLDLPGDDVEQPSMTDEETMGESFGRGILRSWSILSAFSRRRLQRQVRLVTSAATSGGSPRYLGGYLGRSASLPRRLRSRAELASAGMPCLSLGRPYMTYWLRMRVCVGSVASRVGPLDGLSGSRVLHKQAVLVPGEGQQLPQRDGSETACPVLLRDAEEK